MAKLQEWKLQKQVGNMLVSTVRLHWPTFTEIETMVFSCDEDGNVTDWGELYCHRYNSDEEAIAGHAIMLNKLENGIALSAKIITTEELAEELGNENS